MSHAHAHLSLEPLEARENPTVLFTETFNTITPPALPVGWAVWASDDSAAFTTANAVGTDGTKGLLSEANSRTAALAWHPQTVSRDVGAAASLRADSLVPMFVFARGNDLDTSNRSYLAAVVTRGLKVQLLEVSGISTRVLGTVSSPTSSYLSGEWVRASLVPTGSTVKVEVKRADTGQYLNSAGTWQTAATTAITATTSLNPAQGKIGIGRNGLYYGAVSLDDFSAVTDAVVSVGNVSLNEGNATGTATFTVSLSSASTSQVTVQYATQNGTATAGSDYTATSGTLTFNPGETTKTVAVTVLGDTTVEPDETFKLLLSNASGATIGTGTGTATLVNDDAPPPPPPPASPPPPPVTGGVTQSFDTTAVGTSPAGWNGWSTDSTGWFKTATTRALSPANGFASNGFSSTTTRAWSNTDLPADVDVSAAMYLDSLIPAQVFARGTNLQGTAATFYAVNVTRGLQANLVKVVNGVETTIGSVRSTSAVYVSNQWVRTRLLAEGDRLRVQIYRTDARQWLTPDGQWSDSPDFALEVRDATITTGGKAGVGRRAGASGALTVDDFEAKPAGAASGPQVTVTRVNGTGNVVGEVTFRATATGNVNRIEFRLDNVVRAISATSPAEWTFDSTTVVNGDYTLVVRAFDAAGNVTTQNFAFTVANPNRDPLPDPVIPRHYSHIRIAQLAYTGIPISGSFEQNLLRNSVDLVIPNPQYLGTINATAPNTPQLIYSNVSNLYQGLLVDWLQYADRAGVSRELGFYHVTRATPWQGASPSSQPVTWFWGVYQTAPGGTPVDVTSAARGGRNFSVQFGAAGTSTAIGYVEKFREMNITLARAATTGSAGLWEYATAVDASGNPTAWKPLTLLSDGTASFRTSGRITFDPPKDWVAAAMTPGGDRFYSVRYRVTAGTAAQNAALFTVFGRDYANANGQQAGTIPAFDYAADADGDGYLNDAEYANRQAGLDARFVYESRLFYPFYGQMRFVTNPSSSAVRHWAADYHERLLNATPLADGLFMDNATGKLPFAGVPVLEPTGTFSLDSGALMDAVSREIAPRWVLANTAGGATTADAITASSGGVFEEFLIRAMTANWSEVGDAVNLANRRLNTAGNPYLVIDSSAEGGSRFDARTQIATLAYYYLLADPDRTFLMFFGGDAPSTSWTEHWSPAVGVNVGTPTGAMKVFASGKDPANAALNYQVLSRTYSNGMVLYKPRSYATGVGEGTTADSTATTHQLGGTYRVVNSTGTLGPAVTSVTLRNGEGVILLKA